MDIRLDKHVALVTGAGEGIGQGCALALAEAGADVIVNDINADKGKATADPIQKLGRSLAQELGRFGIRVNTISPGFVSPPLLDRWLASEPDPQASLARVLGFHPLGRIGTPQDIGNLVVFLGSDFSSFISGTNITV